MIGSFIGRVALFSSGGSAPDPLKDDALVRVSFDDPDATITSGSFDSLPNRGSLGGTFTATGAARPTTTTQNGHVAGLHTGTQRVGSSLSAATFNGLHNGLGSLTVVAALKPGTLNLANVMISTFDGTNAARGFQLRATSAGAVNVQIGNGTAVTTISSAAGIYLTTVPIIAHVTINGNAYEIFVGGVSVASGTRASPSTSGAQHILRNGYPTASDFGAAGTFFEFAVLTGVRTAPQIATDVAWLSNKWIP